MPELTKEYLDKLLDRLQFLLCECGKDKGKLGILDCDDGEHIIIEIWQEEDGMVSLHPIAKLLTEEETAKLQLDGLEPRK